MKKILLKILAVTLFCVMFVSNCFAGGGEWLKTEKGWKYVKNSSNIKNAWENIDGIDYYFGDDQLMCTGLTYIDGYYYMFDDNGKPYPKTEKFTCNGINYDIGDRGLVINLRGSNFNYAEYKANEKMFSGIDINHITTNAVSGTEKYNYGYIGKDKINEIVSVSTSKENFEACCNEVLNKIKSQLQVFESGYKSKAKISDNAEFIDQYIDEYAIIVDEYKDFAKRLLDDIRAVHPTTDDVYARFQSKIADALDKMVENFTIH